MSNWRGILLGLLIGMWLSPGWAHQEVKLFATTEGNLIKGYAYWPGGRRIPQAKIQVWDSEKLIGETSTDARGEFYYPVTSRDNYQFILDLDDGHFTSYTVTFNDPLPSLKASPNEAAIEKIVNKAINPLREQIEAYEEKIWLHDILGGIGYIFGIMGLYLILKQRLG